ncbi:MAG: hypothetical protein KAV87_05325, partial [Desulfobacteraceae bacterium]|nr:hypothetical protein [Desulfobacteraceae bacterium]
LDALSKSPLSRDWVHQSMGADKQTFQEILEIGNAGSYIDTVQTTQGKILTSPMYFSENPDEFAEIVARHGDQDVKRVIGLLRQNPGCPLAFIKAGEVGDNRLNQNELRVACSIVKRALTQPPAIRSRGIDHHFIFTPRIGTEKIEVIEKHIYERAIAIVSAIRFGQYFADWKIHSPIELLQALCDRGRLKPPLTVRDQYVRLAMQGIVRFDPPPPKSFKEVVFIDNRENRRAMFIAIEMLREQGAEPSRPADLKAVRALSSDASYLEFIRGQGLVRSLSSIGRSDRIADAKVNEVIGTLSNQLMKGF